MTQSRAPRVLRSSVVIEHPTGVRKVIGSIPVGDSDFFFVPCSRQVDHVIPHFLTETQPLKQIQKVRAWEGCGHTYLPTILAMIHLDKQQLG